jgi:hypothetical protein
MACKSVCLCVFVRVCVNKVYRPSANTPTPVLAGGFRLGCRRPCLIRPSAGSLVSTSVHATRSQAQFGGVGRTVFYLLSLAVSVAGFERPGQDTAT